MSEGVVSTNKRFSSAIKGHNALKGRLNLQANKSSEVLVDLRIEDCDANVRSDCEG